MTASKPAPTFLQDADPQRLQRAAAANHREWFRRGAQAAGGEVRRASGALWTYAPGPKAEVMIPFPEFSAALASPQLDAIMDYCRERRPLVHVGCWSLLPPRPRDLGARLLARGFEWGWQPHWMWLDLRQLRTDFPPVEGLRIEPVDGAAAGDGKDPFYRSVEGARWMAAMIRRRPQRVWRFAAMLNGRVVGQSVLNLTAGAGGVAGIYNCDVILEVRNRGIGKAVTAAACQQAQREGCRHALLNATGMGEPVYRRLGFVSLGCGQSWWLHQARLEAPPPDPIMVRFVEAVGRGDVAALEQLGQRIAPEALDATLLCGSTPLQVAVMTLQPAAAEWLVRHGAALDVVSAWDLGWKDRVQELLARHPEHANCRSGAWQITPLHVAAERNDVELARAVLAADPDLEIQDTAFHSTPLGWARHFQHQEIIALIEQHLEGA